MKKIMNNKKLVYGVILAIIVIGIIVTCVFKLNFSLMYREHTKITIYLGKDYELKDIKAIAKEVFEKQKIELQKVEIYNDTPVINVENVSDEQLENLKTKIAEKYEVEATDDLIATSSVAHIRGRDLVMPYVLPIGISTLIILAYVAIAYRKLGIVKAIINLIVRLVLAEALVLSIIAIFRLPIGIYTMPIAIFVYVMVIIATMYNYQNISDKKVKEKKK